MTVILVNIIVIYFKCVNKTMIENGVKIMIITKNKKYIIFFKKSI